MQLKKKRDVPWHQMLKKWNGNNEEENCFKVLFQMEAISSANFDQDFLIFFDGEYKLKSESSSLTKLWAIEEEPK